MQQFSEARQSKNAWGIIPPSSLYALLLPVLFGVMKFVSWKFVWLFYRTISPTTIQQYRFTHDFYMTIDNTPLTVRIFNRPGKKTIPYASTIAPISIIQVASAYIYIHDTSLRKNVTLRIKYVRVYCIRGLHFSGKVSKCVRI